MRKRYSPLKKGEGPLHSFVPKAGQNLLEDSGGCAQGAQAWGKSVGLQKTTQLLSSYPSYSHHTPKARPHLPGAMETFRL